MPHADPAGAPEQAASEAAGLYFGTPRALGAQGQRILCNTAARFFNAEADLLRADALGDALASLPSDIADDFRDGHLSSLLLSDDTALLAGPASDSPFALRLRKPRIADTARVFDAFAEAMRVGVAESRRRGFTDATRTLGDGLIGLAVAGYLAEDAYAEAAVLYLLDLFGKLRSATFEGEPFTTGLLFVGSSGAHAEREPTATPLTRPLALYDAQGIDKRFWFMVDGRGTYYVCDRSLRVSHAFAVPPGSGAARQWLEHRLSAGEALFRVTSRSEFCVSTPDGLDFSYHNDTWRLRDYRAIYGAVIGRLGCSRTFLDALLPFVLKLSNRHLSALVWIPAEGGLERVHLKTRNRLLTEPVSLFDAARRSFLTRQLTSDGATIIATTGDVLGYGCIVDTGREAIQGVYGTGELTARHLSRFGVAIKVSRDGQVQIYTQPDAPAVQL
ncbi:MAG: hypothetical protein ABJF88_00995 [Rhodothermales bacterium]